MADRRGHVGVQVDPPSPPSCATCAKTACRRARIPAACSIAARTACTSETWATWPRRWTSSTARRSCSPSSPAAPAPGLRRNGDARPKRKADPPRWTPLRAAGAAHAAPACEEKGHATMHKDEFLALPEADQMKWLTEQTDAGREVADICEEMGCTRADLQGFGYTWALGAVALPVHEGPRRRGRPELGPHAGRCPRRGASPRRAARPFRTAPCAGSGFPARPICAFPRRENAGARRRPGGRFACGQGPMQGRRSGRGSGHAWRRDDVEASRARRCASPRLKGNERRERRRRS